jgi:hypothetical protein
MIDLDFLPPPTAIPGVALRRGVIIRSEVRRGEER